MNYICLSSYWSRGFSKIEINTLMISTIIRYSFQPFDNIKVTELVNKSKEKKIKTLSIVY